MELLKELTAAVVLVGPVLDSAGAAVTTAVIGDFNLTKNGTTAALAAAATATHSHNGNYLIALTTTNTNSPGRLTISSNNAAQAMSVHRYTVLHSTVFDALITNDTNTTGGLPAATAAITGLAGTIATTTNITAATGIVLSGVTHTGAVIPTVTTTTTATNLTNAPTSGDLTATMKTSVTTAATAATPIAASVSGAVGSVTGNVGGNVVGSVASVTGNVGGNVTGTVGSVVTKTGYALASTGLDLVTAWTTNITGSLSGAVGSVSGNVGGSVASVTGNVGGNVTGSVGSVVGMTASDVAAIKVVTDRVSTMYVLDGAVYQWTVNSLELAPSGSGASASAIADEVQTRTIAGVTLVATVTNLTNAPTSGDLTATMKTSVTTAATAATPIAASVTGAVGSVVGLTVGNLDATVSSRASATNLAIVAGYVDTEIAAIQTTLGTPAGVSMSADVASVKTDTTTLLTRITTTFATLVTNLTAMITGSGASAAYTTTAMANAPAGGGGGTLTGDFAIAVTIQDASNNAPIQNAKVRLYRSGLSGTQPTNVSGLTTFGVDAATWSVVVTASGYVAYTGTLVVTANAPVTIQLTAATVTPPADPSLATLVVLCLDEFGAPEAGVSVKAKISKIPASGTGYAYDATVQEATSGADGIATLTVVRLATYLVKRGTSKEWTTVVIADEATTEVKSFVGAE